MIWTRPYSWTQLRQTAGAIDLAPDGETRAAIAAELGIEALPELTARILARPWLDGVEVEGALKAIVTYLCGVSLDPFDAAIEDVFTLRLLPAGSPNASPADGAEVDVDLEADDPPDLVEGGGPDLAQVVVEHLALNLDPFPRAPGVAFEAPEQPPETSPFAALAALKPKTPDPKA